MEKNITREQFLEIESIKKQEMSDCTSYTIDFDLVENEISVLVDCPQQKFDNLGSSHDDICMNCIDFANKSVDFLMSWNRKVEKSIQFDLEK